MKCRFCKKNRMKMVEIKSIKDSAASISSHPNIQDWYCLSCLLLTCFLIDGRGLSEAATSDIMQLDELSAMEDTMDFEEKCVESVIFYAKNAGISQEEIRLSLRETLMPGPAYDKCRLDKAIDKALDALSLDNMNKPRQ